MPKKTCRFFQTTEGLMYYQEILVDEQGVFLSVTKDEPATEREAALLEFIQEKLAALDEKHSYPGRVD